MRRVTLMLAAVAMMVLLFAVVAYAADIQGTNNSEELNESNKNDQIHALDGDDFINAGVYQNVDDRDRVHGNKGEDSIIVKDGDDNDTAWGGKGDDTCQGDLGDNFISCETVVP